MRFFFWVCIILTLGCYKKNEELEAIPIEKIVFKTTLKNHTPGVDYIISSSLEISKELIIEEGVEIAISPGCEIKVHDSGVIRAIGSENKPVVIKNRDASGRWKGIIVFSNMDNILKHVEIRSGGSDGNNHAAVEAKPGSRLVLENCKVEDHGESSGVLIARYATCSLVNCEITKNNYPIQMDLHAVLNASGCKMMDNGHQAIKIQNQDGSMLMTEMNLTLNHPGLPYYFPSWLIINRNKLTVNSGVTLLFEAGTGISSSNAQPDMYGGLLVNGTAGSPVTFGSVSTEENNKWAGINLTAGYNKIQYGIFNACNSNNFERAVLNVSNYASLDCKNSTFKSPKPYCNISLIGTKVVFNADIGSKNTFANGIKPCVL